MPLACKLPLSSPPSRGRRRRNVSIERIAERHDWRDRLVSFDNFMEDGCDIDTEAATVGACEEGAESPSVVAQAEELCYICMDAVSVEDAVHSVCKCKSLMMHLECQQRLCAEAAAGSSDGTCAVCRQTYSNVQVRTPLPRPTLTLVYMVSGLLALPAVVVLLVLNETAWMVPSGSDYGLIRDAQQIATVAAAVLVALCLLCGLRHVVLHRRRLLRTAVWLHRPPSTVKVLPVARPQIDLELAAPPSSPAAPAAPLAAVEQQP